MPADYVKTLSFTGNAEKALETARTVFINQGFQIIESDGSLLRLRGPGLNGTKENPLKGISDALILIRDTTIEISAELGGVQSLSRFAKTFPLKMAAFFLVVFGISFGTIAYFQPSFRQLWIFLIVFLAPLLALSPWIFLAPMMARRIEKRTIEAIDTLLNNLVINAANH